MSAHRFGVGSTAALSVSEKRCLPMAYTPLQVAKPDFGSLLKTPAAQAAGTDVGDTGPQIGTILWYNGRRKSGLLLADRDQSQLRRSANIFSGFN